MTNQILNPNDQFFRLGFDWALGFGHWDFNFWVAQIECLCYDFSINR